MLIIIYVSDVLPWRWTLLGNKYGSHKFFARGDQSGTSCYLEYPKQIEIGELCSPSILIEYLLPSQAGIYVTPNNYT